MKNYLSVRCVPSVLLASFLMWWTYTFCCPFADRSPILGLLVVLSRVIQMTFICSWNSFLYLMLYILQAKNLVISFTKIKYNILFSAAQTIICLSALAPSPQCGCSREETQWIARRKFDNQVQRLSNHSAGHLYSRWVCKGCYNNWEYLITGWAYVISFKYSDRTDCRIVWPM